ncbi:TonB-dependent receptor [Caulobacter sp. 17J80-11]|uniref:TonB-dependent receptor n=1 Tax=Caulobacter sp. 17J80-11 TaxID=2763502 RepID=UPI001653B3F2|nr:TonB-dependent receptor [Caulobacter sp. 17J80-11]MBC6982593.1 TonB-dependent receptor [Caulobacter sp. 17J80-11]
MTKRARALRKHALVSATALATLWPALAFAQAAPAQDDSAQLEEIVVTAQKREQRLQDVPITVNAFNAEAIEALGAQQMGDLQAFTPGLSVDDNSVTQPKFAIRGIATDDFGIGTEPSAAVFIDGVYSARTGGALIFFDDLERVEVLKGPQGTLFGRNAAAGAISITTRKPSYEFEGDLQARIGNYGKTQLTGMINVPLSDTVALRVNGLYNKRDGWLKDAATGEDLDREGNWSGRAALRWRPTDSTDIQLSWDHDDTDKDGPAAVGIGPFAMSGGDPFGPFANDVISSHETRVLDGLTLNARHDFGDVTLTSITSWKKFETANREDEDGTNIPELYFDTENREENKSFSQELRLSHDGDRFHWIAGVSYFQEDAYQSSVTTALTDSIDTVIDNVLVSMGGSPISLFHTLDSFGLPVLGTTWTEAFEDWGDNRSWAAYGDLTWAATDKLNLTVGLRYTDDERTFSWLNGAHVAPGLEAAVAPGAAYNAILGGPFFPDAAMIDANTFYNTLASLPPPLGMGLGATGDIVFEQGALEGVKFKRKASFNDLSPRFVVDYKVTPDMMVFGSIARGYKAGGFNSLAINSYFEPESVWNYEGGVKSEWLNHRLRVNASAYYFQYDNRQQISLVSGGLVPQYQTLTGDSEAWGVDLEAVWKVTPNLTITESAGYIDSTWIERTEFPLSGPVDISGQPTGEPNLKMATGVHYERDVANLGEVFFDASYSYVSAPRKNDASYGQRMVLESVLGLVDYSKLGSLDDSRNLVNARIGWNSPDGRYTASVWAENLLDERTVASLNTISATSLGTPYVRLDQPRFWGVQLGVHF